MNNPVYAWRKKLTNCWEKGISFKDSKLVIVGKQQFLKTCRFINLEIDASMSINFVPFVFNFDKTFKLKKEPICLSTLCNFLFKLDRPFQTKQRRQSVNFILIFQYWWGFQHVKQIFWQKLKQCGLLNTVPAPIQYHS